MTSISIAPDKLNVGEVFSRTLATLRSKLLFFVFTGLMVGIAHLAISRSGVNGPDPSAASPGLLLIGAFLLIFLGCLAQVLCARATEGALGAQASLEFAPAVQAALPRVLPVFLTALASAVLFGLGFVALVIPGVLAAVILAVSVPACCLEELSPLAALKRSRELTRGNRWRILGLILLNALVLIGVGVVVSLPLGLASTLPGVGGLVFSLLSSAVEGFVGVFSAVLVSQAFLDLRRLRDAATPAPLV